ncbi:MAG: DUF192 domain-containing protein, partial [Dehalococcoidia bacterium]
MKPPTSLPVLALCLLLAGCGPHEEPARPAAGFSSATISVVDGKISRPVEVEVAFDGNARRLGLMYRQELADGRGMLFLYPDRTTGGHWMANTYIPLDVAYAAADGVIFEIIPGRPLDATIQDAGEPFVFV